MRTSYLSSSLLPPGTIVAWRVSDSTMLRASLAKRDPRPLTADQVAHVKHAPDAEPGVAEIAPWLGISCELPNATRASVSAMLSRYFDRHEALRCVLRTKGSDRSVVSRHLVEPGAIEFEPCVLGSFESAAETYDVVADHLAKEARCATWPYVGIVTIEHATGTMIIAAFDHIASDGYSLMITVDEFQRFHEGGELAADEFVGSHLAYSRHEDALVSTLTGNDGPIEAWRSSIRPDGTLPPAPIEAGLDPERPAPHKLEHFEIGAPADVSRFVAACRANGTPVGLGFIALLTHSALELQESDQFDMLMSTHNRMLAEWQRSVGWFAGVAPFSVMRTASDTIFDTMRRTVENWLPAEPAGVVRLPLVNELLAARAEPSVVVSYIDARRVPGSARWSNIDARVLLGPVAPSNQIHLWVNSMPEGLVLETRYPVVDQTGRWIEELAAGMRRNLRTITEHAGAFA